MSYINLLKAFKISFFGVLVSYVAHSQTKKPNIIFGLADDLGYSRR